MVCMRRIHVSEVSTGLVALGVTAAQSATCWRRAAGACDSPDSPLISDHCCSETQEQFPQQNDSVICQLFASISTYILNIKSFFYNPEYDYGVFQLLEMMYQGKIMKFVLKSEQKQWCKSADR